MKKLLALFLFFSSISYGQNFDVLPTTDTVLATDKILIRPLNATSPALRRITFAQLKRFTGRGLNYLDSVWQSGDSIKYSVGSNKYSFYNKATGGNETWEQTLTTQDATPFAADHYIDGGGRNFNLNNFGSFYTNSPYTGWWSNQANYNYTYWGDNQFQFLSDNNGGGCIINTDIGNVNTRFTNHQYVAVEGGMFAVDFNQPIRFNGHTDANWQIQGTSSANGESVTGNAIVLTAGSSAGEGYIFEDNTGKPIVEISNHDSTSIFHGNVGVGIATPLAKFHVVGTFADSVTYSDGTSGYFTNGVDLVGSGIEGGIWVKASVGGILSGSLFGNTTNFLGYKSAYIAGLFDFNDHYCNSEFRYDSINDFFRWQIGSGRSKDTLVCFFANDTSGVDLSMVYGNDSADVNFNTVNSNEPAVFKVTTTGSKSAVQFIDGTQGAGKILTSDADGIASWTKITATNQFDFSALPQYANNAAALLGGLTAGQIYVDNSYHITVVHN